MPFQKGHKIAKGRPKGAVNKVTSETRERIIRVIEALDTTILEDLADMKSNERAQLWRDLQEFVAPKLSRQDTNVSITDIPSIELHIGKKDKGS